MSGFVETERAGRRGMRLQGDSTFAAEPQHLAEGWHIRQPDFLFEEIFESLGRPGIEPWWSKTEIPCGSIRETIVELVDRLCAKGKSDVFFMRPLGFHRNLETKRKIAGK